MSKTDLTASWWIQLISVLVTCHHILVGGMQWAFKRHLSQIDSFHILRIHLETNLTHAETRFFQRNRIEPFF